MKFNYQARTKEGEVHAGKIEASSRQAALSLLQEHGLYVTFLESAEAPIYAQRIKFFERISRKDLVLFSRQLAIMFKSKVPLVESLKVLAGQTKSPDFKEKLLRLSEEVEGGTPFSKALANYPDLFSSFYIAMVKSGEVSGKLSEVLDYLAEHLEKEYHLTSKARSALIYPSLVLFVVVVVLVLLILFVIPQLSKVLEGSGQPLPTATIFIINFSNFVKSIGWLIFILFFISIVLGFRFYTTKKGKEIFDTYILKFPLIGSLLRTIYLSRFAENLSTLISGGLPIAQALETVGDIIENISYKKAIFETRNQVRKGEPISSTLSRFPDLFSPFFVQMVLVGERTGTLDSTLMNVVDFYQKEVDRTIDNVISIMEPALIIFLGVTVGGLMLSILAPLYRMIAL